MAEKKKDIKTYKVKKKVAYQNKSGRIFTFKEGSQITSKDLLNNSQEKAFVKDGFLVDVKKKAKKEGDS